MDQDREDVKVTVDIEERKNNFVHFPRDDDVEVHRVSSVHARMIQFQNINHPRQILT